MATPSSAAAAAAAAAASSTNALRVYRRLLGLAKNLPQDKQALALVQIRQGFRDHAGETDAQRVSKLLEQASSTLGYLKMVTPKRRIGTAADTSSSEGEEGEATGGRTYLVYKDGEGRVSEEAMRREKAAYSNWDGSNMDPDNVRRHQHQLSRMGFRNNTHAKGGIF